MSATRVTTQGGASDPEGLGADRLVGVSEVAAALGVRPDTVHAWRHRHADFPAPRADLAMGPVWWLGDVTAWAGRRRRAGRPRKAEVAGP